jgi:hypothetical protein
MKTNCKSRYQIIEAILSQVEFEVDTDNASVTYEDNEIFLSAIQWFDNEGQFIVDAFEYKGEDTELTPDEQQLVFKRLCQVHRNFKKEQEAEALYSMQDAYEVEDTRDFITANFHSIY